MWPGSLLHGATFADLSRSPRKPYAVVYASDMGSGARFEFTQDHFDYLCADLDAVPLARAVAAMRVQLDGWRAEIGAAHARGDFEVFAAGAQPEVVEVGLADTSDAALRERLLAIPTTLQRPAADVAALRRHGADALRRSPAFRRLLQGLDAE